MKKSKDWRAFMLDTYGDNAGIAPIKSARFWAAMLVGGYLYKRIDYVLEFAGLKDHSDLQLGGTLGEVIARRDLFEWECLMMSVDFRGFHSPWNKKASNAKLGGEWKWYNPHVWTLKQQAQYVKEEVEKHQLCIDSASHRNTYWLTHAKPVILERDLFSALGLPSPTFRLKTSFR